jgi:hypothetical protein
MRSHQILKPRRRVFAQRPVPHVELSLLLHRSELRQSVRAYAEADVEILQDVDPPVGGFEGNRQILSQIVDGEWRPHPVGKAVGKQVQL